MNILYFEYIIQYNKRDIINKYANSINIKLHNKSTNSINLNFTKIGLSLFVLSFTLYKSFLSSNEVLLMMVFLSLILIVFSELVLNKRSITITYTDMMWGIFLILLALNIMLNNLITGNSATTLLVYGAGFVFLIISKVHINYFDSSLKLIKILSIIYAMSALFQYFYTNLYISHIIPLFPSNSQIEVLRLLRNSGYTGFTNQTAHLAGYIVNGFGAIIFTRWLENNQFKKIIYIIALPILFIALLLSAKRAHLLFLLLSIIKIGRAHV